MWERIYNSLRVIFNLGDDIKTVREKNEKLQEEVRALTNVVHRLAFELERVRENETHEREKMELRLKLELSQRPLLPPQKEEK